jgi:hypothetical protein
MEENNLITDEKNSLTQNYNFSYPPEELTLESGEKLGPITLAYETYGKLNAQKSNAILVLHALSGNAHVAETVAGGKTSSDQARASTPTSTLSYAATSSAVAKAPPVHPQPIQKQESRTTLVSH